MSMLDVAKYLIYSRSVDVPSGDDRFFNLSMANSGRLFCCLYGDRLHGGSGREEDASIRFPPLGKGL